jgi:3-hydroxyisobutyrate dehydrogenase-like beta-hydroxyacid dehydrogenase
MMAAGPGKRHPAKARLQIADGRDQPKSDALRPFTLPIGLTLDRARAISVSTGEARHHAGFVPTQSTPLQGRVDSLQVRTIGIVSPGAMGSAMADALARGGARTVATVAGRSQRTSRLADRARIECLPDLAAVVREADLVLSIVPPEAASAVADDVIRTAAEQAVRPLIADLNAIAPETALRIGAAGAGAGLEVVDGSISGPPPWKPGTTRLYLSGPRAADFATLPFDGVDRIVVGAAVGAASAVKMSTASVYKGTSALLMQALLAAHAAGVLEHVLTDLRTASPGLVAGVERRLASAATKSGRYVAEMNEIAASQSAAGLTPSLFEAMAEVYAALASTPFARASPEDLQPDLSLQQVLDGLR